MKSWKWHGRNQAAPEAPHRKSLDLLKEADQYLATGRYDFAIGLYQQSINLEATAESCIGLSRAYFSIGKLEESISASQKAIAMNPDLGRPYNIIGACLIEQGSFSEALPWLELAIRSRCNEAVHLAYFNLGRVQFANGEYDEARNNFQQAIDLSPHYFTLAYAALGVTTVRAPNESSIQHLKSAWHLKKEADDCRIRDDLDRAIELYKQSIELHPLTDAYGGLGLTYLSRALKCEPEGNYATALDLFEEAVHLFQAPPLYNLLGHAYYSEGKLDLAIESFQKAIVVDPLLNFTPSYVADSFNYIGVCFIRKGENDNALAWLERALNSRNCDHETHYHLGCIYVAKKRYNPARYHFKQATKLFRDFAPARDALRNLQLPGILQRKPVQNAQLASDLLIEAERYEYAGETDTALELYKRSLDLYETLDVRRKLSAIYFTKGNQREHAGDQDGALSLFKRSVALWPSAEGYSALGGIYYHKNRFLKAIAYSKKAINLTPEFGDPYNHIAVCFLALHMNKRAIFWYEKALEASCYEWHHYSHYGLGRAYARLKLYDRARHHFEEALRLQPDFAQAREGLATLR